MSMFCVSFPPLHCSDCCALTSELLTAGGAVGRLEVAQDAVANAGSLVLRAQGGRKHDVLAVGPLLPLLDGQGLGEAEHEEGRAEE